MSISTNKLKMIRKNRNIASKIILNSNICNPRRSLNEIVIDA